MDGSSRAGYYSYTTRSTLHLSPSDSTTILRFTNSVVGDNDGAVAVSSADYYEEFLPSGSGNSSAALLQRQLPVCPNFANQQTSLVLLRFSLSGVFLTIVCLLGACSNLAAFMVLFSSKKFNQSVYIYMKCLAFNDFIMLITFLVFALYALTFMPSTPPEIYLMATNALVSVYRFWFALAIMCQGQSLWFMSLITLDRCFALSSNFYIRDAVCRKCVALVLSSVSFAVWFSFFLINTFIYYVEPFCIYPNTNGQVMNMYLPTDFAAESWLFRVTFAIIMKFVLPVLLTVVCISYSTAILIHTISATAGKKRTSTFSGGGGGGGGTSTTANKNGLQMQSVKAGGLVDTDNLHMNNGSKSGRAGSIHEPLQSQNSSVHGGRLRSRIQTAHALSWAIAASMIFCHLPASSLLLVNELTKNRIASEPWFAVANEIANVLISSSSAINFLLFFLSGAKYRAEMNRLLERIKRRLGKSSGPPARYRCYNFDAHGAAVANNAADQRPSRAKQSNQQAFFFGPNVDIEDIHLTNKPSTQTPFSPALPASPQKSPTELPIQGGDTEDDKPSAVNSNNNDDNNNNNNDNELVTKVSNAEA